MSENDKFDLSVWKSSQERIDMVLDPDCPLEILFNVATYDLDRDVILHVGFAPNCTDDIFKLVAEKLEITLQKLTRLKEQYKKERDAGVLQNYCAVPWMHVATNANGSIRMCCQMIHPSDEPDSPSFGTVYKDDGKVLMGSDDITQHRNAPAWKKLRRQFLNGEKPDLCKLCYDEEENGIGSRRQWTNKVFNDVLWKSFEKTDADGTIQHQDFPIQHWDLRFGNKCNLACRSCAPTDSSLWYDDWAKLTGKSSFSYRDTGEIEILYDNNGKGYVDSKIFDWYDESPMWNHIIDNLHEVKRFYFTGGEPTINLKHRELLQIAIDKGLAKNIILDYNTNMAGVPTVVFKLWKEFKEVHLGMSIDGIYEHFEYIRYPGKWNTAYKNLKRVDTEKSLSNVTASFTTTVSVMNVLHLLDMQWWMKEQNWNRINSNIVVHNLYSPSYYNIQNLPNEIKHYIRSRYKKFFIDIRERYPDDNAWCHIVETRLNAILTHMDAAEPDMSEFERFFKENAKLDAIRGEDAKYSIPEILQLMESYNEQQRKQSAPIKLEVAGKK